MSNSLDRFTLGLTRAVERRRAKAQQQAKQIVEKVHGDSDAINTNTNTTVLSDKQYQVTIVQKMTALIHKRKMK